MTLLTDRKSYKEKLTWILKKCILETEKYAKIIIYSDKKLTGKRFSLH